MAKINLKIKEKFKHTMISFCSENNLKVEFSESVDNDGNIFVVLFSKKAEELFNEKYKKVIAKYGLNK